MISQEIHFRPGRVSPPVTPRMAARIKRLLAAGYRQHDIAAIFGINQGRISEINTGKRFRQIPPEQGDLFEGA